MTDVPVWWPMTLREVFGWLSSAPVRCCPKCRVQFSTIEPAVAVGVCLPLSSRVFSWACRRCGNRWFAD
jgi:hypothetical protein